jgi:hypothetical protein
LPVGRRGCGQDHLADRRGWEIIITCEPSVSVVMAPARSAIERTISVPAALWAVATTAQDGIERRAGNEFLERGFCRRCAVAWTVT